MKEALTLAPSRVIAVIALTVAVWGCGGGEQKAAADSSASAQATPPPTPTPVNISITMPAEGDTVRGSAVHVMLSANGVELAPAADQRPGTAHHHLYLDTDLSATDAPIPAGTAGIVHLGKAETEYHWDKVTPGKHRIIAILADPAHVPLNPLVADTVNFVVVPPM